MSGLLRRLTQRRAATADETRPETPAASEPVDATASTPAEPGREQPVPAEEQPTAAHDLPAGVDPDELASAPGDGARRGSVRRRVRYLRAVREVLLRDLGGFSYEIQRTAGGTPDAGQRRLVETKTARLAAIDGELRELEGRLGEAHPDVAVLRQPGIGGTCPECGELHASEAAFCWRCGAPLTVKAARRRALPVPPPTTGHGVTPAAAREAAASEQPTAARLALWMKSKPGAESGTAGKPEAAAKPAPAAKAEPAPNAATAAKPEPAKPDAAAKAKAGAKPDAAAKAKAGAKPDAAAKAKAGAKAEAGAKAKPTGRAPRAEGGAAKAKPAAKATEPSKPAEVPADEQPAVVERPTDPPPALSEGDPLATPAERRP